MPFALVTIGLILVVTGARGTMTEFGNELKEDFTGPGNFVWWIVSIGFLGFLGYIPELRGFSRWFMTLVLLSMIIANRGFFNKFIASLQSGPESPKSANSGAGKAVDDMLSGMDKIAPENNSGNGIPQGVGNALGDAFKRIDLSKYKVL